MVTGLKFMAGLRGLDRRLGGRLHLLLAIAIFTFGVPLLGGWLGYGLVAMLGVFVLMFGRQGLRLSARSGE